jgi:hypothetical protein
MAFPHILKELTSKPSGRAALRSAPALLGTELGFDAVLVWEPERQNRMCCREAWVRPGVGLEGFEGGAWHVRLHLGSPTPAELWQSRSVVWTPAVAAEPSDDIEREAARAGLTTSVAAPLCHGQKVTGMLQAFALEALEPDDDLTDLLTVLGRVLGGSVALEEMAERPRWRL